VTGNEKLSRPKTTAFMVLHDGQKVLKKGTDGLEGVVNYRKQQAYTATIRTFVLVSDTNWYPSVNC
jgi:hypothetical protein